jgi:hypothetical protein
MQATKQMLALMLTILLSAPATLAQTPQRSRPAAPEVQIILQPEQVRFTAPASVEQMRLQVFNQAGELVFDSQPLAVSQLTWLWLGTDGQPVKSGPYAYTLTIKDVGTAAERVRRGHFIVDRARERDTHSDRVWLTSQDGAGLGTELTVSQNETGSIAGARQLDERAEVSGRASTRPVEETEKTLKTSSEMVAAALAGTVGKLAKFTTATEVGDSVITEAGGNIGIGTATPKHRLSILGAPLWTSNSWGGALELQNGGAIAWQTNTAGQRAGIGHTNGGTLFFRTNSDPGAVASPANYDMVINDVGNVGIGTTAPLDGYKLHVAGSAVFGIGNGGDIAMGTPNSETGMTITRAAGRGDLRFEGSTLKLVAGPAGGPPASTAGIAINTAGRVGVGTTNPATKLHVESPGFAEVMIKSTNERAILSLSNGLNPQGYVWTLESGVGGQYPSLFGIYNRNVGRSGLEIDGNLLVYVKALQINGGADFAENFDVHAANHTDGAAASDIQPGRVVAIDPANPGKLSLSRRAYDRRVAGIISGAGGVQPGMTMGQENTLADGKYPVALSGRVYCWVDAARGAIQPGDLLTTSATPGHAMKVTNAKRAQGAIIGKAMTGLKTGKGLVLVLVTLQ